MTGRTRPGRTVDPVVRELAARVRSVVEAAEAAGTLATDRAEWLACAAQELVDGRIPAPPHVAGVREVIVARANEMLCVGPEIVDGDVPGF